MRWASFAILGMLLAGCASQPQSVAPAQPVAMIYTPATSTAAWLLTHLCWRGRRDWIYRVRVGRFLAALCGGFNEATTQYYSLTTDDWYSGFCGQFRGESRKSR